MSESNKKTKGIYVIAGLALAGVATWLIVTQYSGGFGKANNGKSTNARLEEILKKDRVNLSKENPSQFEIYGALIRLARSSDSEARRVALSRANDPSAFIRQGVADALGYYDDSEASSALQNLTRDKEQKVRLRAIQAMGHKKVESREKYLLSMLNPKIKVPEKVAVHAAMIRVTQHKKTREASLDALISIAEKGDGQDQTQAALKVISLSPRTKRVIDLLKSKVESNKNDRLVAVAVRYIAGVDGDWFNKRMNRFLGHKNRQVRISAIMSLHRSCPSNRWSVLENLLMSEKDSAVLGAVLREPLMMPGVEAVEFVKKALARKGVDPKVTRVGEKTLASLTGKGGRRRDPCASKKSK